MSIPVDSTLLINQILEKDSQKHLDTANRVYELGNGEEYIDGKIIRRGLDKIKGDTIKLKSDNSGNSFIMVPQEAQLHLTFSDGTKVWLNGGTILTFSGNLTRSRYLRFGGEACFDVAGNKEPLTIETQGGHKFILKHGNISINTFDSTEKYFASLHGGEAHFYFGDGRVQTPPIPDQQNKVAIESTQAQTVDLDLTNVKVTEVLDVIQKQTGLSYTGLPGLFKKAKKISIKFKGPFLEALNKICEEQLFTFSIEGKSLILFKLKEMILKGNSCITFGKNVLFQREKVDPTIASSWVKGFFEEDSTLTCKPYFESIGRWYDVEITFPKTSLHYSFEGKIPLKSSLKATLELFKYNNVKYKLKLNENGDKLNLILL